jgi:diguanylate cyclase (GGDEF)-like protein
MDIAARYGGDEFVLLFPRAGPEEAATVAERIRQEYRAASAAVLRREQGVTMSVGITALRSALPSNPEQLVIMADAALYQAKEAGRDRGVILPAPAPTSLLDVLH